MNKKRAKEIVEELLSHYRSEWEGTSAFGEVYPEYKEAIDYIKANL